MSYPIEDYDIYVTGFPQDLDSKTKHLYTASGNLCAGTSDRLCYNTDMCGGDSGAPVYIKESYSTGSDNTDINTVIRINVAEKPLNYGVVMTPLRLKFYVNNPEA